MPTYQKLENKNLPKILKKYLGVKVVIWTGKGAERSTFAPAINISGELEKHPDNDYQYRVLIDPSNYCYFTPEEVIEVIEHPQTFKGGAKAVIKLFFITTETLISKYGSEEQIKS